MLDGRPARWPLLTIPSPHVGLSACSGMLMIAALCIEDVVIYELALFAQTLSSRHSSL